MSIEDIIRAWKADDQDEKAPENPAGEQELSDNDLEEVSGGACTTSVRFLSLAYRF